MKYRNEKSKSKESYESKKHEKGEKREPKKGGDISGRKNYKGKEWC